MVSSLIQALLLGSATLSQYAAASPRVVKMPVSQKSRSPMLYKRDPFAISLQNYIPYGEYFVTASVGTPAQDIELIVDTGSSDIWMFGKGSCTAGSPCEGGQFDESASSTAEPVPNGKGAFVIQYQTPGSGVKGDYITDTFEVGGISVENQTMAVATRAAEVPSGIMGIGLSTNEAAVSQGLGRYPNFPDLLVAQGKIPSKSYSLYLDDITTSNGMILFGGYDYNKFKGELTMLPIQLDDQSGERTSFTVAWTGVGINTAKGDQAVVNQDFLYGAVLDTGTTLTYMPTEIYSVFAEYFETQVSGSGSNQLVLVDCDIGKKKPGQVVFSLGGADGVQIAVEHDELAVPIYDNRDGRQATLQDGTPACQFGLSDAGSSFSILFGQTFLRSAYVLYDLDNLQLGVAQTIFDSTTSNIMEYNGNSTTGRIQSDLSGPTVTLAGSAAGGATAYGSYYSYATGLGSISGAYPSETGFGGASGAVAVTGTAYNIPTFKYPSGALPTAFPTTIGAGSVGPVDTNSGGNAEGGSGSGSSGNGGSSNQAGSATPMLATAGALMLALFTVMLTL